MQSSVSLTSEILVSEKEKATKEYYDLVCGALKKSDSVSLNPIEAVFHSNMKASFLEFEKYFEDLRERNERMKSKLKASDLDEGQVILRCAELDANLAKSIEMIVEAYDKHMKNTSPSPDLLPVRIFLKVPKKGLTLDLHVPRTHTCNDLRQVIIDHYNAKNDCVENLSEGSFLLHQALNENSEITVIGNEPLGKYAVMQGSTVFFDGDVVLKSDAPKECFTKRFRKGEGMKTNYFHCFNCNANWICEPCSQVCHLGHNISVAIPNHEPTWACCYCVKKGLCCIPNNKS